MKFGWINLFGGVMIMLMMIPNIIYGIKNRAVEKQPYSRIMAIVEQVGRYACIIFMWLPLLVWEFGFKSVGEMVLYAAGNVLLLVAYYVFWIFYSKRKTRKRALVLAILPTCIFLMSGLLLRHWLLVISAVLFGTGHIFITQKGGAYEEI